jgi:N-acetylglutamate synthase-like GNAT family acetyltransferase
MEAVDINAGLSLCRHAGWNQLRSEWELFLKLSPAGCIVAVHDSGKVVGTVTTVSYEKKFSWIGMVLVDPGIRRQGIGTTLLQEAIKHLCNEETLKLDATPAGRAVYRRLNFVDEYPLSRMQIDFIKENHPPDETISIHADDLEKIATMDEKVFGANRSTILQHLWNRAPQLAFLKKRDNNTTGFCFGRPGYKFTHIGPVIAESVGDARELVRTALQAIDGPTIIDVPHHSTEWTSWLKSIGFTEQRPFMRMYRGTNSSPGLTENQFAILGPEFG